MATAALIIGICSAVIACASFAVSLWVGRANVRSLSEQRRARLSADSAGARPHALDVVAIDFLVRNTGRAAAWHVGLQLFDEEFQPVGEPYRLGALSPGDEPHRATVHVPRAG